MKMTPQIFKEATELPLSPPGNFLVGHFFEMRKDPLGFFSRTAENYGDIVPLRFGFEDVYMVNHPDHVQRIFQGNRDNYVRSKYYGQLSPIIGEGLFTLEGKAWRSQRKASQPAVSGPNLTRMSETIVDAIEDLVGKLKQRAKTGEAFDFAPEAFKLKLKIVMRALFSADLNKGDFQTVLDCLTKVLREIETRVWEPVSMPIWMPTGRNIAMKQSMARINEIIEEIVAKRLEAKDKPGDLLDMLIEAEQACGWDDRSFASVRDQVISIAIAGHETGAITLSWATYLLSHDIACARLIRDEARHVLGDGRPTMANFGELDFTQRTFKEILRLYPPLWTVSRQAVEDDYFGDIRVPKGAILMISPFVIQRNPRFWDNPLCFDPDRFVPEAEALRPKFSYFPFGGGPHLCLGNRFGTLEGVFSLAMIFRDFDFDMVGERAIQPYPATTLRPDSPVTVTVKPAPFDAKNLAA